MITSSLILFNQDLTDNAEYYKSTEIACIDKACQLKHLYSNVLLIMVNRMLKLLANVLRHRLPVEPELTKVFEDIASQKKEMTKTFALTIRRITTIEMELRMVDLESKFKS